MLPDYIAFAMHARVAHSLRLWLLAGVAFAMYTTNVLTSYSCSHAHLV